MKSLLNLCHTSLCFGRIDIMWVLCVLHLSASDLSTVVCNCSKSEQNLQE